MKTILFLAFSLLLIHSAYPQSITGELISCTNEQLSRSDVQILSNAPGLPKKIIRVIEVNKDGNFNIKFDTPGFYNLRFCGAGHKSMEVPFYLNTTENIYINIFLEPNRADSINELKIIGDFNNFSFGKSAIKMEKNSKGNYVATITATADTFAYQILGLSGKNNSVNHSQADYLILDAAGDYISVLNTKKDARLEIVVDPINIDSGDCFQNVVFKEESISKFVYTLIKDLDERNSKQKILYDEFVLKGGDHNSFKRDWTNDIKDLEILAENSNSEKKAYYYFAIIKLTGIADSTYCNNILNVFSENSPIWSISPQLIRKVTSVILKQDQLKYFENVLSSNQDETIKPFILLETLQLAQELDDNDLLKKCYELFINKYPDSEFYLIVKNEYSPDRNIQVGKKVPAFEFISVLDSSIKIDNEKIKNNVYLLDFWATWCGPCIEEMQGLHEAYKKYKSKGLNIISVSMDFNVDDMLKFRKEKWPLPWFNSYLKYDPSNKIVKDFELITIPKPILISRDGYIIATGLKLRGNELDKTLANIFIH